jgi:hypothetical protein
MLVSRVLANDGSVSGRRNRVKGSRRVVVVAAMAVVVLVSPGIGAGKVASPWLAWTHHGIAMTSYGFPTLASGSRASTHFRLANWGRDSSGKFAIHLTGSSAFSIRSNGCAGRKTLRVRKWCRVTVAYAPSAAGGHDHAVLMASREHKAAARLNIYGCGASARIYWGSPDITDAVTVRAGLFAEGCVTPATTLARANCFVTLLAVDDTYVYWANICARTLNEVPLDGGKVTTLASGLAYPTSLAADGTHVFWADNGGRVNEVSVDGGSVTALASGQSASSLAVDGTHVFWTNEFDGTVNEVPVGGGTVTTLASDQKNPGSVAVDPTHVFWLQGNSASRTVNEVPLGGGSVTTLASGQAHAFSLAVDSSHVYWSNYYGGTVNEVPVGGGSVTTLATGQGYTGSLAVDGAHVYWAGGGAVKEVPVGGGAVNTVVRGYASFLAVAAVS